MSELAGKVVAIAGAAGGLGPSVAARLAEEGATLALAGRDRAAVDRLAAELDVPAERVDAAAVDLLDAKAARAWAARLGERFGRVDALLHLVGGWRGGEPLPTTPLADYELLHDLLVRTLQHSTRAFHDALVASAGRFVLVSSTQAHRPTATNASYAAAKAAAEAWTLALADSLSASGATANVVVVEAIETPAMRAGGGGRRKRSPTPAEDVGAAITYLLSGAAAPMNGQRLELHR